MFSHPCISITSFHSPAEQNTADLIYLDPSFNSNRIYNRIYSTDTELPVLEEAIAFCDVWGLTQEKEDDIQEFNETLINDGNQQFSDFWSTWVNVLRYQNPKILSYLVFMAQRLWVMKAKLKDGEAYFCTVLPQLAIILRLF
ncbi:hypothetical protein [Brevinema andersonii]|uniref:hypothetical protein n=1 Tax=Brevinema andersonii TaxID=34097 RepID=UPI000B80AFC3|nr:hypothetical protein [Brevinema andersonii]